ncbi:MAG: amidohydrolase family protein [Ilumatobacteraceae bacterium]
MRDFVALLQRRSVTVWTNATVATMDADDRARDELRTRSTVVPSPGAGDTILAVGSRNEVRTPRSPAATPTLDEVELDEIDLEGRLVTPGLVDCHTHLVFAGSRAAEFERRIAGATYAEIAAAGGGIRTTMTATRTATEDELVAAALPRLDALIGDGVTTVEIKSGYGLDLDTELRLLRAAHRLATERHVAVVPTLLAAHTVPPEFAGRADDYIRRSCATRSFPPSPAVDSPAPSTCSASRSRSTSIRPRRVAEAAADARAGDQGPHRTAVRARRRTDAGGGRRAVDRPR